VCVLYNTLPMGCPCNVFFCNKPFGQGLLTLVYSARGVSLQWYIHGQLGILGCLIDAILLPLGVLRIIYSRAFRGVFLLHTKRLPGGPYINLSKCMYLLWVCV
jgi:hypothetical protein